MSYLPLIIIVVVLFGFMSLTRRNRARLTQQQSEQRAAIGFGTDVMTTSGLYGTVVGVNDDDTVQLSIAPGVEVKWVRVALRDVASLPATEAKARADAPDAENDPRDLDASAEPTDKTGPAES